MTTFLDGPAAGVELVLLRTPDGHDFHERTREQAAHDRSRDRYFQAAGLTLLRFTGSELHGDVDRCVADVERVFHRFERAAVGDGQLLSGCGSWPFGRFGV